MIGFKLLPIVALAASALASPIENVNGTALEARAGTTYTGDATFYSPGLGACGITNGPNDFIAAASYKLFDTFPGHTANPNNNPICGKSLTAKVNGKSVTVKITDRCAGCQGMGDLDFTPAAFQKLAPLSVGRIHNMKWSFN
ncbi:barwin-like endoglucanase [Schizopora paradoxa]|uniref:Barwin-like endoglucanase n=1 Tax=Schizopora paradoxa TaxID=27342 RepID=A0A0H2RJ14_9AGAM|nr:barwin-like endoglucanase [Schizopora paradoxa]